MRKCARCGETDERVLEKHHVIPRVLGGTNGPTIIVCRNCHKILHCLLQDYLKEIRVLLRGKTAVSDPLEKTLTEFYHIIADLERKNNFMIFKDDLLRTVGPEFKGFNTELLLNRLIENGEIYEVKKGYYQTIYQTINGSHEYASKIESATRRILSVLSNLESEKNLVPEDDLLNVLGSKIQGIETKRLLNILLERGIIYRPIDGVVKRTNGDWRITQED